jgi:methionine-rich copper-binding protein CopC
MMRFLLLFPLCFTLAIATAGEGSAHSKLKSSIPANNSTVADNMKEARLDFLEPIEAAMSHFTLVDGDEAVLQRVEGQEACQAKTCRFAVEPLKPGKYRIDYHILSADGHVVEGKIRFTVKAGQ